MTMLAIVLGVTMISSTYVLTDTINAAFGQIFEDASEGADVVISGHEEIKAENQQSSPSFDEDVLDEVKKLPGVAAIGPQISDVAAVVGNDGKLVKSGGAPTMALSYVAKPFEAITIAKGRAPAGADEVALDAETVRKQKFKIGQQVAITSDNPLRRFKLVGTTQFGSASLGGTTMAVFDLRTAQELFDKEGKVDFVAVAAKPGVKPAELVKQISALLPRDAQVKTATQQVEENTDDITGDLGFLRVALLAFAGIAIFVGAFGIFNTFSITVAQRQHEFGMLRMLGARRRQIIGTVTVEALVIGLLASVAGIGLGWLAAAGIYELFAALEIELPTTDRVLQARTIVVSLLVGVVVTLIASVAPALRASRVAPLEALRNEFPTTQRRGLVRLVVGILLTVGGGGGLAWALLGSDDDASAIMTTVAICAIAMVIGIAMLSRKIIRPAAAFVGWPIERVFGMPGKLARENSARNPGRTASTAAALMIGLALVVFVTVFAEGLRNSINVTLDRSFGSELTIFHSDGWSPMPAAVERTVAKVEGVERTSSLVMRESRIKGAQENAMGVEPGTFSELYKVKWTKGSAATIRSLKGDQMILSSRIADKTGYKVGDTVPLNAPSGETRKLKVTGIYKEDQMLWGSILPLETHEELFNVRRASMVMIDLKQGADVAAVEKRVDAVLKPFPEADVRTLDAVKKEMSKIVDGIVGLFYGLLAMSVIVALFGIVNTLTLSIYERTRELGVLRAIGMTRRQVRRMVRYESVITAMIGAALGLALGVFFAFMVTQALKEDDFTFTVPWGALMVFVLLAIVAGIVAAILPARRAAKTRMLEAIALE